jgi:hypothetical protein
MTTKEIIMKVVKNICYGGFGISKAVFEKLGIEWKGYTYLNNKALDIKSDNWDAYRSDKRLISAIEEIGVDKASAEFAQLKIVEIPDGIEYEIDDYDGMETIREKHRSW